MSRVRLTDRISKAATFTEGLDQIASDLENQGHSRIALHIDRISDHLDKIGKKPIVHKPGDPPDLVMTGDPLAREVFDYKTIREQLNEKK
jgi:hypothetical protein